MTHAIIHKINEALEAAQETDHRSHLGGSLIGDPCERKLWYGFRWSRPNWWQGRMLRLFERGHLEEHRFVKYLQLIGASVAELDPETGKQWRVLDVDGHFGGSLDGLATGLPGLEGTVLLEFKTHNTKSFGKLTDEGVKRAKPMHWNQMQLYMYKRQLTTALYMAVNKNDDDLYAETVEADWNVGAALVEKARRVIHSKRPPERQYTSPAFFECKWCDFRQNCWYDEPLLKNCRTCVNSTPVADGQWHCAAFNGLIPVDFMRKGCDSYSPIGV